MKPLPFPFPLNIGTDIVHIPRITRLLARPNYLGRFTRRILCTTEQSDFNTRFSDSLKARTASHQQTPPVPADITRWLAGRFAAKEAARKAAPEGAASIGWKDVMVRIQEDGGAFGVGVSRRPEIVYLPREDGVEGRVARLSISHDGEYVVATVLAAG
jgi:holo-[acyl-carrier protein] synthase